MEPPPRRGAKPRPRETLQSPSTSAVMRRMASADRSMSSSVVDQLLIEMRIAAMPCHVVPPSQQVPSSCTRAITVARERIGVAAPVVDAHQHLIQHHVVEDAQ